MTRRKGLKMIVDKAEASKTIGITVIETTTGIVESVATAVVAHPIIIEPRALEPCGEEVVLPGGRVETLEGEVREVDENQDDKDKEDGKS